MKYFQSDNLTKHTTKKEMKIYLLVKILVLILDEVAVTMSSSFYKSENFEKNVPSEVRGKFDHFLKAIYHKIAQKYKHNDKKEIRVSAPAATTNVSPKKTKVTFDLLEKELDKLIKGGVHDFTGSSVEDDLDSLNNINTVKKKSLKSVDWEDLEDAIDRILRKFSAKKEDIKNDSTKTKTMRESKQDKKSVIAFHHDEPDLDIKPSEDVKPRSKAIFNKKKTYVTFEELEKELEKLLELENAKKEEEKIEIENKVIPTHEPTKRSTTTPVSSRKPVDFSILEKKLEELLKELKNKTRP